MEQTYAAYYKSHGRIGVFMRPWHKKHKLTHKRAVAVVFGSDRPEFYNSWKNWQTRTLPPEKWTMLVETTEERLKVADEIEKKILIEFYSLLHDWPYPAELKRLVDRALKKKQKDVEDLLKAVDKQLTYQRNQVFGASEHVGKFSDHLKANREQLDAERSRDKPRGLEIAKLQEYEKDCQQGLFKWTAETKRQSEILEIVEQQHDRLNEALLRHCDAP